MKVRDIMTQNVACVKKEATVLEVAQLMEKLDVGAIPVCNKDLPIGMITDRDILSRIIAKGNDPSKTFAQDVMTDDLKTVTPDTDVDDVSNLMAKEQIRRVPVVENQKLVGIVALADIASDGRFDEEASESISEISKPNKQ